MATDRTLGSDTGDSPAPARDPHPASPAVADIRLACGHLRIRIERAEQPLDQLLDFASRRNPKRGFLFVSRVLGKHLPCAPSRLIDCQRRLAAPLLASPGPILVVGLAETATGLGGGLADYLARDSGRHDVLYQHSTRHPLSAPLLVAFDEDHSHAPDHLLYWPTDALAEPYFAAATLVLVDDEITSGRTLTLLAQRLAARLPRLERILFVSLVNWLSPAARAERLAALPVPGAFVSLLDGQFDFTPAPGFRPALPPGTRAGRPPRAQAREDTGRRALRMPWNLDAAAGKLAATLPRAHPVALIGIGEFAYPPLLIGERLEAMGFAVSLQGSTRSPVLPGGAIAGTLDCRDEHGAGVANYLHNPPGDRQRIVLLYESAAQARLHDLPAALRAWVGDPDQVRLWACAGADRGGTATQVCVPATFDEVER